jgi:hypothetical protein
VAFWICACRRAAPQFWFCALADNAVPASMRDAAINVNVSFLMTFLQVETQDFQARESAHAIYTIARAGRCIFDDARMMAALPDYQKAPRIRPCIHRRFIADQFELFACLAYPSTELSQSFWRIRRFGRTDSQTVLRQGSRSRAVASP